MAVVGVVVASTCGGVAQCPPAGVRAGIGGRSSRQGERLGVALCGGGSVVGVSWLGRLVGGYLVLVGITNTWVVLVAVVSV